jgi:hypothetical protein
MASTLESDAEEHIVVRPDFGSYSPMMSRPY